MHKGRGKFRNILITGPANCGKTFLLKPLSLVYRSFVNPATSTFAWVGAEQAELLFLNDFRGSPQVIPWHDMLLLLEGEPVHLPAPKTHYTQDILLTSDTPIFATSSSELQFIKHGVICDTETEIMKVRWKIFNSTTECQRPNKGLFHYVADVLHNLFYKSNKLSEKMSS